MGRSPCILFIIDSAVKIGINDAHIQKKQLRYITSSYLRKRENWCQTIVMRIFIVVIRLRLGRQQKNIIRPTTWSDQRIVIKHKTSHQTNQKTQIHQHQQTRPHLNVTITHQSILILINDQLIIIKIKAIFIDSTIFFNIK